MENCSHLGRRSPTAAVGIKEKNCGELRFPTLCFVILECSFHSMFIISIIDIGITMLINIAITLSFIVLITFTVYSTCHIKAGANLLGENWSI